MAATDVETGALPTRLRFALASSKRWLDSVEDGDPQKTMDPIRTGAPAARRATEIAVDLVADLCRRAKV